MAPRCLIASVTATMIQNASASRAPQHQLLMIERAKCQRDPETGLLFMHEQNPELQRKSTNEKKE